MAQETRVHLGREMDIEHQNKTSMKEKKTKKKKKNPTKTNDCVHYSDPGQATGLLSDAASHGTGKRLDSVSFKGFFTSDSLSP